MDNLWMSGWWYTYPSEKYESQLGLLFLEYVEKIKHVPATTNQIMFQSPPTTYVLIYIYMCMFECVL